MRKTFRENEGFSNEEVGVLQRVFRAYDNNGNGTIGPGELRDFCEDSFPEMVADTLMRNRFLEHLADDGAEVCDWLAHPEAGVVFLETRFLQRDGHQLAAGLHYCHVNHVIHRDIKPHNILVHLDTTTLKLADFGLARPSSHFRPLTPEVISLWYRPPELLMRSKDYDVSVDIWSFGCILSEMATGKAWPGISSLPFYAEIFPHRRVWLSKSSWPRRPTTSRTFSRRQL